MRQICAVILLLSLVAISTPAAAEQRIGDFSFSGSGFMTVGVGHMLGGTRGAVLDKTCPCFVADYAQNA
ncbi:MAG: hypothetical protein ABL915_02130, partial [Gallionella sp.]